MFQKLLLGYFYLKNTSTKLNAFEAPAPSATSTTKVDCQ